MIHQRRLHTKTFSESNCEIDIQVFTEALSFFK